MPVLSDLLVYFHCPRNSLGLWLDDGTFQFDMWGILNGPVLWYFMDKITSVQTDQSKVTFVKYNCWCVYLPYCRKPDYTKDKPEQKAQICSSNQRGGFRHYSRSQPVIILQCNGKLGRKQQQSVSQSVINLWESDLRVIALFIAVRRSMKTSPSVSPTTSASYRGVWFRNSLCGSHHWSLSRWIKIMDNICP